MRARIRKEMETPSRRLEQRVAGGHRAGVHSGRRGAESQAAAAPGQDHRGDRQAVEQGPHRHGLRPADRRRGLHQRGHVHHVGAGRGAGAAAAVGLGLQRLAGHRAGRPAGQGASASARLRHVSAHPAQVCARGEEADARRRHPQVHRAPGAADAASPTAAC